MRIVRFRDDHGEILHGEESTDGPAIVLDGSLIGGFQRTSRRARIAKLLAPLIPTDIICIGRNFHPAPPRKEAASDERPSISIPARRTRREEDGDGSRINITRPPPDEALEVFLKPSTSLQNPNDAILIPHFDGLDVQLDCEGELAVIIGREARNISENDALSHIFGYTLANDITARHFQTTSGGGPPLWMRGKGFDTFCPLGPAIITADELPDPQDLRLRTIINGKVVREGHTRDMIRTVPRIVAALSRHMTLRAGAVLLTGAPPAAPATLRHGDRIDVEIPNLLRLSSIVVQNTAQNE